MRLKIRRFLFDNTEGALVMSIYSAVDAIVVGQAEGPIGAAAMAVITPLYGILAVIPILIYLLPVIMGINGIWIVLPVSEVMAAALVLCYIKSKVHS